MKGSAEDHQERGESWEVLQKIIRSEVDHERCCRRAPGPRWSMICAAEYHQERGGS